MQQNGHRVTSEDYDAMLRRLDYNLNSTIDYQEYIVLTEIPMDTDFEIAMKQQSGAARMRNQGRQILKN